jgi:CubicO group peptidase (beta-lactamase class C family)
MRANILRLILCISALVVPAFARAAAPAFDQTQLSRAVEQIGSFQRAHSLIVARDGKAVVERVFRGPSLDTPVNVKSASKTIIDALVGIAIDKGMVAGTDQPILPLLKARAPAGLSPKVGAITLDHLLSMRAGLERTSGRLYYGRWVASPNWIQFALSRPFTDEPGGIMLYSTGNTHLLSAILTDVSGRTTLDLLREWLGKPLNMATPSWTRDPQGVYFGGNEMAVAPRALLRFGEMFRNRGVHEGTRVLPESWVRTSWTPRTHDRHDDGYGYGWFITEAHGQPFYYAWGFGGQMLYVVPSLALTIVVTSDSSGTQVETDYHCALQTIVGDGIIPAAMSKHFDEPSIASIHGCHVVAGFPP